MRVGRAGLAGVTAHVENDSFGLLEPRHHFFPIGVGDTVEIDI